MFEVTINDFIDKVKISNKRRPIFYKLTDDIPKKYQTDEYMFVNDGRLVNKKSGESIIKNTKSVGKERFWKISGQDLWSGIDPHLRSKVAKEMKKYFYEFFRGKEPIKDYPIGIEVTFYDNHIYDIDNQGYIYVKTILDSLCGNVDFVKKIDRDGNVIYVPDQETYPPIIEQDDNEHIKQIIINYVSSEEKKLIIKINKL